MNPKSLIAAVRELVCVPLSLVVTAVFVSTAYPLLAAPRVYRDRVEPHWFSGNDRFWYRVNTSSNAHEFVLVDAVAGTRRAAFDHVRLAEALIKAGLTNAAASSLPIDRLDFAETNQLKFHAGSRGWVCDLQAYTLAEEREGSQALAPVSKRAIPRATRRTGDETSLTFVNQTTNEVQLFWLDTEGERKSYGKIQPGGTHVTHTFAGHVWIVTGATGKTIAAFEATEQNDTAEIKEGNSTETFEEPKPEPVKVGKASPDGAWLAWTTNFNVVLRRAKDGRELNLTQDGSEADAYSETLHWSPDSKKLAVLRTRKGDDRRVYLIESSPKDQLQPKLHSYDYLKPGDQVPVSKPHLFDVETTTEIKLQDELYPNPWSVEELRWDPDSSRFTFIYNQRGHQVLRIIAVDASTGVSRAIVDERNDTFIDYSGKQFVDYLGDAGELLWMSERDGWNHLYLYDSRTGRVKNQITKGEWVVRGVDRVDREQRQVWFRAGGIKPGQDPYFVHTCRVNFDGSGMVVLTEGNGTHAVRYSPDDRFLLDTWSRVDAPPTIELRRSTDGSRVCVLEEADTCELKACAWRAPEAFVAKGRDGQTDIYGVIHWPRGFEASRKYPVIESIYAGPQDSFVPKSFRVSHAQDKLTDRGFIVVQMDGMGTSNRSKKFHDVCWKNLVDAGLPDRILWLKAAAAKFPSFDLNRVGIYGTSAGGQSALGALLTHPEFYKAGVSDCGCHDNRMDKIWWNEQWMGWPVGPHYAEQSNVTLAKNLQGKLLLAVGELDRNVDPASTMQVVNALIKADKDFEMLVVPGSDHGALGSPYGQRRLVDFFVRHLGGS